MDSISLPLFYSLTVCASQQQATATNHLQLTHAFNRRIAARTHTLARVHTHTHTLRAYNGMCRGITQGKQDDSCRQALLHSSTALTNPRHRKVQDRTGQDNVDLACWLCI
eukprot:1143735-Pelagomonas_calceolata.AAC.1